MKTTPVFFIGTLLLVSHAQLHSARAATAVWSGNGDGVSWNQAANWSNNVLPAASDDVVIAGVSTNVTITLSNVTVRSLQCSASLSVSGGDLSLTNGASEVTGNFTVASGRSLSVSGTNTIFTADGSTTLNGANLYARNGAVLLLPAAGQATRTGSTDALWQASGAGSRIVLAGLTNVAGYYSGSWWRFQASSGGRVELPALVTLTNGWFQAYADGSGAVVDLSGLSGYQAGRTDQYLTIEARNGGSVLVPNLTDGQDVELTLRSGGTISVAQFTRLAELTLDGVSAAFSNLSTLDDIRVSVLSGAVLELPAIRQARRTSSSDALLQASGTGSRLVLAGLTNVAGYYSGGWWRFQASSGGRVELPAVATLTNGWFQAYADGSGAVIDLSGLSNYQLGRTDQYMAIEARNSGSVLVPNLTDGQDVELTLRSGGSVPVAQFTRLAGLTLDAVSAAFSSLSTLDDTRVYALNGAVIELPTIRQARRTSNSDAVWQASGAGSRIVLAGLTNVVGYLSGGWWRFQAYTGGRVEMPALATLTNGWFQAHADGSGAVVDLSGLTSHQPGRADQYMVIEARNSGSVLVPNLTDGQTVDLTLRSGGTVPVGQITRLSKLTLDGVSAGFSGLVTLDDTSVYAQNGAVLELPGIAEAKRTSTSDTAWQASGAGSRIVLAGLTNLVSYAGGGWWRLQAYSGGRVELPALPTLTNGWFQVYAEGTAAVVDLSGLASYRAGHADHYLVLEARNGGAALVPQLTSLQRVALTLRGTNSVIPVAQVKVFEDTDLYAYDGAVLDLSQIGEARRTGNSDAVWYASGAGSRIVLAGLTNLVPYPVTGWWRLQAYNGGRVELPALATLTNCWFQAYAEGTSAAVDLPGLTGLAIGAGKQVVVNAKNGGLVDLGAVQSISGGRCSIIADGTGSVIDLSSLSAFATPLATSELTARNGGVVLLPTAVILLANVAVSVTGHPVLPPVLSAGPAISLYGRAWHSYWVEVCDLRVPGSPWQFFSRVAQTNDLMVIGGAPSSWQAFRVWEFLADPPILDFHRQSGGQVLPILFGTTNQAYQLETTATIDGLPAAWSPWGASTGTMTNSFRILPAFRANEAQRFWRARQE